MPEHKHLGPVDRIEPPQTCPICETRLVRVVQRDRDAGFPGDGRRAYVACECVAKEDSQRVLNPGLQGWGEVVLHVMRERPDLFPPGSMPGPIDLS